ncbi:MAG: SAM-dependent methyltransferase [Alteromonadaceae bacterium]|nr:MAG: SAM-dependent methyltransferase [Alteromonadaceae bacterium]
MSNKHSQDSLKDIERITVGHYESRADVFWTGTRDHDVSQNVKALLQALPQGKALDILDFGCGPGRDLLTFKNLGHRPTGLDGSESFCKMARKHSACPVLHQQFLQLELERGVFDGIFANASLFHIPSQCLPNVLSQFRQALRPEGILFMSNPRGNDEGWNGQRYGHYIELEQYTEYLEQAGFKVLDHYYRPEGKPREEQPWLAIVSQIM